MLPWQFFAKLAAVLAIPGLLALLVRRQPWAEIGVWVRQLAFVSALYALWQVILDILVVHTGGAFSRALWVWRVERDLHLPSEVAVQRAAFHHPWLVRACNHYYSIVHFPALGVLLAWILWRHRDRYWNAIGTLVLLTGFCALIQAIPVAPPRFLPGLGFIDAALFFHQSDYGVGGTSDPGQLITMPSVHVGWAIMIAVVAIMATRSRWRWLVLAHPIATMMVVVITGNHFWLDGIVAGALLVVAMVIQWAAAPVIARLPAIRLPGWREAGELAPAAAAVDIDPAGP